MNNYNFDGHADGDWEERGDISWNEVDWQRYLKRHELEVDRFITLYNQHLNQDDRLDEVAHLMGWDAEDWSMSDGGNEEESLLELERRAPEELELDDFDPYTLQRHPVYVVVKGLYAYLRKRWEQEFGARRTPMDVSHVWRFAQLLHEGESSATLSIQALDMGDFALAVCQLKHALQAINETFQILPQVVDGNTDALSPFEQDARVRLFDLREVCLRVMNDCREEIRRHWRERD